MPHGQSRRFRVLLLLLATASAPVGAVINGVVAGGQGQQQWPVGIFDASALPPDLGGATCGAFLIAPDWVLTAGLCVSSIPVGTKVSFYAPADAEGCGGPNGHVSEVFTYPDNTVQLLHLDTVCGLHFTPFILNDGEAPAVGTKLYDLGWGASAGVPLTGNTTVTAKSGLAADEIAFTGTNLFCTGSNDDGGPHFDYGSNGFPVAYAIFGHSDAGCSQYNVSVRVDALVAFITSHVSQVCLRSNPTGVYCDGLFRSGMEKPLN